MTEIILVMNGYITVSYNCKLMYGQINDTKHTKTFISHPFATRWTCGWSVIYMFFAHGARVGREKKKTKKKKQKNIAQRLKKLFHINFNGSVGKPETIQFF